MKKNVLPEWLKNSIPEIKDPSVIFFLEDLYCIEITENDELLSYSSESIVDLYDFLKETNVDISFDKSVPGFDESLKSVFVETGDKKYLRMLIGFTDKDYYKVILSEYERSLKSYKKYLKNKKSFKNSYLFVSSHPIFWMKNSEEKSLKWEFSYKPEFFVSFNKKNKPIFFFDAGSHVEPNFTEHYFDPKLQVRGNSIEELYIKLAKRVNKFYNPDGTEKENVKYKKSNLEKTIDNAIKRIDEESNVISEG